MVLALANQEDVYVETIGALAFGSREHMRRDTIFRIASMTKPVLATANMLVEDGALALDEPDEPVVRLLPELAHREALERADGPLDDTILANRRITVENLLTFRLRHGMVFEPTFQPHYPIITAADKLQLVFGPSDPRTSLSPAPDLRALRGHSADITDLNDPPRDQAQRPPQARRIQQHLGTTEMQQLRQATQKGNDPWHS
jgi:hypothetical protein